MMYVRFPLSLRNVEDLWFERGIDAIIASGSGWIKMQVCLAVWIMVFSFILSFLLPKGSAVKSSVAKICSDP